MAKFSVSACLLLLFPILLVAASKDDHGKPLPLHLYDTRERHLKNIVQLTFGGENAEAYFSFDEQKIIYQAHDGEGCDQIYIMNIDGTGKRLVSTGKGRTTCAYFLPNGEIIYASTHEHSPECPPVPDRSRGYVWPLYPQYEIYRANADGSNLRRIIQSSGYDAEATVSPKGDKIVFTSSRDGDLELYSCDLDGSNLRRLTYAYGYDGGAFYSFDGTKIVFRASRPTGADSIEYAELLSQHLIRPRSLEIYVMDADGSNIRQVTNNGAANFAPFFHPDGKRIIFSSNLADPASRNFDLYIINIDGTGLERITYYEGFDGFPMFSRDGKKLLFCSNRNGSRPGETNVFIADWVE